MTSRITVLGDVLLDRDVLGSVGRVCPDAPVPVVDVATELARPGGAGLAAALLAADGHDVTLVTALADDPPGVQLREVLEDSGVRVLALPTEGTTRQKVRVRAAGQSLLRLDSGTPCIPTGELPGWFPAALLDADAVLVCDYAGGMSAHGRLRAGLTAAAASRPLVWDPHLRGAPPVPGARLVTPNLSEASALVGRPSEPSSRTALSSAQDAAEALVRRWSAGAVAVTMGAGGALVSFGSGPPFVVPAEACDGDTCGAGDRFAASAVAALAAGRVVSDAVQDAVRAASAFVAAGGAGGFSARQAGRPGPASAGAHASWDRVRAVQQRGGTVVATGGCFDLLHAGHVSMLRAARALGDSLVVCLNSDASVRRLKGAERPLVGQGDRAAVLEGLECVDAVLVFDEDTPVAALRRLRPQIWVKGGDYAVSDLPEAAVVAEWGGQTVLVPYLDGRSTTGLIGAAAGTLLPAPPVSKEST